MIYHKQKNFSWPKSVDAAWYAYQRENPEIKFSHVVTRLVLAYLRRQKKGQNNGQEPGVPVLPE